MNRRFYSIILVSVIILLSSLKLAISQDNIKVEVVGKCSPNASVSVTNFQKIINPAIISKLAKNSKIKIYPNERRFPNREDRSHVEFLDYGDRITTDMNITSKDAFDPSVFYHEFGHLIDYNFNISGDTQSPIVYQLNAPQFDMNKIRYILQGLKRSCARILRKYPLFEEYEIEYLSNPEEFVAESFSLYFENPIIGEKTVKVGPNLYRSDYYGFLLCGFEGQRARDVMKKRFPEMFDIIQEIVKGNFD